MLPKDMKIFLKNQNRKFQKQFENHHLLFNHISFQFLNYPKKSKFDERIINYERKESLLRSLSKEFNKLSLSFYQKQYQNYNNLNPNLSINNSCSKLKIMPSTEQIKKKKKIKSESLIRYKKINESIHSIVLYPFKNHSMNRKGFDDIFSKNKKEESNFNNIFKKNNLKKKEETLIKINDKSKSMSNSLLIFNDLKKKRIKLRNVTKIPIFSKSKNELNSSKKILLKLGNNNLINFNPIEKIDEYINKINIPYPINSNINNSSNVFYYTINQMYFDQLSNYFQHRINWVLIQNKDNPYYINANFQWKYFSNKISFKRFIYNNNLPMKKLKMTNLFERNYELGNKKHFFHNLVNYCDKHKINVFDIVPFTIIFSHTKISFETQFKKFKEIYNIVNENLNSEENIILNKQYSEVFDYDKNLINLNNTPIFINKEFLSEYNYWIIKPSDLYQGKCIEINNNCNEIFKICKKMFQGVDKRLLINNINEEENNENEKVNEKENEKENDEFKQTKKYSTMHCSNDIIIQKYLDYPLLYYNRKFDIRCFVLVDSNFNVYYCKEGHLKGSSEKYDLNNTNKFIHITNHSVQKKCNKFEKYEFGNEMSYNDFKKYLIKNNISLDEFDKLISKMKNMILISMNSVKNKLMRTNNVLCFEIFGYDFIIDKNFKPYILEINNNPGLGISSPLIEKIIPRMLDDAFRLTIDKVFNTIYDKTCIINGNYISKYKLDGLSDNDNIFEFLCNIKE